MGKNMSKALALGLLYVAASQAGQWDFLKVKFREPRNMDSESLVSVGPSRRSSGTLEELALQFPGLARSIETKLQRGGFPRKDYHIEVKSQYKVKPEDPAASLQLEKYVMDAMEHFRHRIRPLPAFRMFAMHAQKGVELPEEHRIRLLYGHCFVTDLHGAVIDGKEKLFDLHYTLSMTGGFNISQSDGHIDMFIGTGNAALMAPFSEMLPLFTSKVRDRYAKEHGWSKARQADETLVEGISYILAQEMVEKYSIPDGRKHISRLIRTYQQHRGFNGEMYKYVSLSIPWLELHGIQAGWDLYMEDPELFMQAIGAWD